MYVISVNDFVQFKNINISIIMKYLKLDRKTATQFVNRLTNYSNVYNIARKRSLGTNILYIITQERLENDTSCSVDRPFRIYTSIW